MSTLKICSMTLIVNGYTTNNGLPCFQKAVPEYLRKRLGKANIKIPLKADMVILPFLKFRNMRCANIRNFLNYFTNSQQFRLTKSLAYDLKTDR